MRERMLQLGNWLQLVVWVRAFLILSHSPSQNHPIYAAGGIAGFVGNPGGAIVITLSYRSCD